MTNVDTLLRLVAGSVTYPNGTTALKRVDLQVRRGEFLVLLGPSGSGKSTLLRCLNGLVALTEGHLSAEGLADLGSASDLREHRRRTALVFQQHHLIGRLRALDNVLTGRLAFHTPLRTLLPLPLADKRIALEALSRVGLLDHALERADKLSGGQQQRVGIARALAQQPRLLLADEPVASLDPVTALRVLEMIHGICKTDRIATVVSLHQVALAQRFADRIVGIHGGRVVFEGEPAALDDAALHCIYGDDVPAEASFEAGTDRTSLNPGNALPVAVPAY